MPYATQSVAGISRGVDAYGKIYYEDDHTASWVGATWVQETIGNLMSQLQTASAALAMKADASALVGLASQPWVSSQISGKANATDLGSLAAKSTIATGDISNSAVTLAKLASAVQTSLGKADTAVQPAALTAKADNFTPRTTGVFAGCSTLDQFVTRMESVLAGTTANTGMDVS